jgi:hypothetical protein
MRKFLRLFDPMTIWLLCCLVAGVALLAHPHFGGRP